MPRREIYGFGENFTVTGEKFTVAGSPIAIRNRGATREANTSPSRQVTKGNDLISTACYSLSLDELRLILIAISKLDPRALASGQARAARDQAGLHVTAEEFSTQFGVDRKNAYGQLKRAAARLWGRTITQIGQGEGVRVDLRWLYMKAEYSDAGVTLFFSPPLLDHYLVDLKKNFTSYRLGVAAKLRSVYAVRIFELCARFKSTGVVKTTAGILSDLLCVSYTKKSDLARWVLDPATSSIRLAVGLEVSWRWVGEDGLEFRFEPNPSAF